VSASGSVSPPNQPEPAGPGEQEHVKDWAGREMGFQVTVAGTGDQNKDQSGRPSGGIEQEQNFVVYLPTSVQVLEPSAVLASLPLIPATPNLNSI